MTETAIEAEKCLIFEMQGPNLEVIFGKGLAIATIIQKIFRTWLSCSGSGHHCFSMGLCSLCFKQWDPGDIFQSQTRNGARMLIKTAGQLEQPTYIQGALPISHLEDMVDLLKASIDRVRPVTIIGSFGGNSVVTAE